MSLPTRGRIGALRPLGILDRHMASLFFRAHLISSFCVLGLMEVMCFVNNATELLPQSDSSPFFQSLLRIAAYLAMETPFLFVQVAPFVTMFAGICALASFVGSNEWIATLGCGIPMQRVLAAFLAGSMVVAGVTVIIRDVLCESIAIRRDSMLRTLRGESEENSSLDLWFRSSSGQAIHADRYVHGAPGRSAARIEGLLLMWEEGDDYLVVSADEAVYGEGSGGGEWTLVGGLKERYGDSRRTSNTLDALGSAAFSPDDALLAMRALNHPLELSLREARALSARDPQDLRYRTLIQSYWAFPFANLTLLLIGLPLVLLQRDKPWNGVLAGLGSSLVYFTLEYVFRTLGMDGSVGPVMASWIPQVATGSVGIVLYTNMRT